MPQQYRSVRQWSPLSTNLKPGGGVKVLESKARNDPHRIPGSLRQRGCYREEVEARCSGGTGKVCSKTPGHSGPSPTRQRGPGSNNTHMAEGYSS